MGIGWFLISKPLIKYKTAKIKIKVNQNYVLCVLRMCCKVEIAPKLSENCQTKIITRVVSKISTHENNKQQFKTLTSADRVSVSMPYECDQIERQICN